MTKLGRIVLAASLLCGVAGTGAGCEDNGGGSGGAPGAGGAGAAPGAGGAGMGMGGAGTGMGGAGTGGMGGGSSAAQTELRVIHLSPNAPLVDLCLQRGGGEFSGPLLFTMGEEMGLDYGQATRYLSIDAGTYTVRVVAAGVDTCDTALPDVPDTANVVLDADLRSTLAAIGHVTPEAGVEGFRLVAFEDRSAPGTPGTTLQRVINAVPNAAPYDLDIGKGSGQFFNPLLTQIGFGEAGIGPDGGVYLETPPRLDTYLTVRLSGTPADLVSVYPVNLPADQVSSIFMMGNINDMPRPLSILICRDLDEPMGNYASCQALP